MISLTSQRSNENISSCWPFHLKMTSHSMYFQINKKENKKIQSDCIQKLIVFVFNNINISLKFCEG